MEDDALAFYSCPDFAINKIKIVKVKTLGSLIDIRII